MNPLAIIPVPFTMNEMVSGGDLIGRRAEQSLLSEMFDPDTDERAIALRGEPGAGKTVLIDQHCREARARGWRVVRTLGAVTEEQFALAGVHQIIFGLQDFVDQLDAQSRQILAPVYSGESAAAVTTLPLVGAVLSLLSTAATDTPLLVVVDDVHWLDDVSAQILDAMGRRLIDPGVRILAALRPLEQHAFTGAGWRELALLPLNEQDSGLVLDQTGARLTAAARAQILTAAAGNPLALSELPRCAGQIATDNGSLPLTERLVAVFAGRLDQMQAAVKATLLRAALDGSADGTGANRSRYVMSGVESAVAAGLLTLDQLGRPVFRHSLVQSAVIYRADEQQIREAHRELAELYHDVLLPRAFHLAAATDAQDQEVSDLLVRAAKLSSRRGGLEVAVKWLRRAAELSPDPRRRDALFADAVFVAARAGRLEDTWDLVEERESGSQRSATAILAATYREFHRNGEVISTHRWILDALSRADSLDDKTVNRLAHLLVSITNYSGDTRHWEKTNAALAGLESRLNPVILMYQTGMADLAGTGAALRTALVGTYVEQIPRLHARQIMMLAFPAYCVDATEEFRVPLRLAYDQLSAYGASIDAIEAGRVVMLDLMATGRWAEGGQVGLDCLAMAEQRQGSQLRRHQLIADLGLLAAMQGDMDTAHSHAEEVRSWAEPRHLQRLLDAADRIDMRGALAEADYEHAYRVAAALSPEGTTPRHNIREVVDDLFDLVDAAVRSGRLAEARERAETATRLGICEISPRVEALTSAMTAMTAPAFDSGLYSAALTHPGLADSHYHRARIALAQGISLRKTGDDEDARAALESAAEGFDRLGARQWATQARNELAAAEAPNAPQGAEPAALTSQERRVAELAAGGLPSRKIAAQLVISPRTVDTHLYRVFRKLGISRRSELHAALAEQSHDGPAELS